VIFRSPPWNAVDYWSLDLETSGLQPRRHQIISVGMVPIRSGAIDWGGHDYTLVRPEYADDLDREALGCTRSCRASCWALHIWGKSWNGCGSGSPAAPRSSSITPPSTSTSSRGRSGPRERAGRSLRSSTHVFSFRGSRSASSNSSRMPRRFPARSRSSAKCSAFRHSRRTTHSETPSPPPSSSSHSAQGCF
jgi:hypothetical protein